MWWKPSSLLALCLWTLSGCAFTDYASEHPIEIGNFEADSREYLARNPELADFLDREKIPQDSRFHYSGSIKRLTDRQSGEAIGWSFDFRVKLGLPHDLRAKWVQNASRKSDSRSRNR